MRSRMPLILVLTLGCGRVGYERIDATIEWDAGGLDASRADGGDGAVRADAGPNDAGPSDAGSIDAGPIDAGEQMQVLAIAADLDDGELETTQSFGTVGYAPQGERSGWTYMGGYDSASAPGEGLTASFFRFGVDRAIAPGSTVTRAVLRLFGADTWAWDPSTDYEWIAAEDVADASRPTQRQDAPSLPTGRPITARVRWPASPPLDWTIGDWNETTDFAAVVQELVDRYAGLATGAHVQIFVFRDGGATDGEVAAEDWSSPASHPAELVLAWR